MPRSKNNSCPICGPSCKYPLSHSRPTIKSIGPVLGGMGHAYNSKASPKRYTGSVWYQDLPASRVDRAVERFARALFGVSRYPLGCSLPSTTLLSPGGSVQPNHRVAAPRYTGEAIFTERDAFEGAEWGIGSGDTLGAELGVSYDHREGIKGDYDVEHDESQNSIDLSAELRTDGSEHVSSFRYDPRRELFDLGMSVTNNLGRYGITDAPSGRSREQVGWAKWKKIGKPGRPSKKFSGCITLSDTRKRRIIRWTSLHGKLTSIMRQYVRVWDLWNGGETLQAIADKLGISMNRVVRMVKWLYYQSDGKKSGKITE